MRSYHLVFKKQHLDLVMKLDGFLLVFKEQTFPQVWFTENLCVKKKQDTVF